MGCPLRVSAQGTSMLFVSPQALLSESSEIRNGTSCGRCGATTFIQPSAMAPRASTAASRRGHSSLCKVLHQIRQYNLKDRRVIVHSERHPAQLQSTCGDSRRSQDRRHRHNRPLLRFRLHSNRLSLDRGVGTLWCRVPVYAVRLVC